MQLMRLTEKAKLVPGVADAVLSMGTGTNKMLMEQIGLLTDDGRRATENDLVLAVKLKEGANFDQVMSAVGLLLTSQPTEGEASPSSGIFYGISAALNSLRGTNLAVVSLPGNQAGKVTEELLNAGVNVHLFSDHVPVEDEVQLKKLALSKGLVVLGPGAGTSIINGVGLGFANAVARGNIGIVAAAGTGLQEVSVLLDRIELGVSQGFGVGGSDVSREVGGAMMTTCLKLLEDDENTSLLMIVAKTPNAEVVRKVMTFVDDQTKKPVVACFLGMEASSKGRVYYSTTLHSAVLRAAKISSPEYVRAFNSKVGISLEDLVSGANKLSSRLSPGQKYLRGLYTGGTLAHESLLVFRRVLDSSVYSNSPLSPDYGLPDPRVSRDHTIIDLGDEFFTEGRAHPMIDPTIRKLRVLQEAKDDSVAVIMMDFVLGYGSSEDPGGSLADSILEGKEIAAKAGRELLVMGHVCGTSKDPQSLENQSRKLIEAGVVLYPTNATMAIASALAVSYESVYGRLKREWDGLVG
jgi:FdrA protein